MFSDASNLYYELKELNSKLDSNPELVPEFVEKDIRHRQCWTELEHLNKTGKFLWKHPILVKKKATVELLILKRDNTEKFMSDFVNVDKNITRYKSLLKNTKLSEKLIASHNKNLQKYELKKDVMLNILKNDSK